jgi:hypothetical protein
MRAELAILQHSASNLDRAQAGVMQQNSRLALANAKQNEVYAQDTARGQVVDFLNNIDDTRYPHGSDDRQAFIGKVFGNRPDWLHVMAKDPHLAQYVQDHVQAQDKVASTMAQLKQLYPDEDSLPNIAGTRMVPSVNAKGGVSYRGSTATSPEAKNEAKLTTTLLNTTGLTPDEFSKLDPNQLKAGGVLVPETGDTPQNRKGTFHEGVTGFYQNGTPKGDFSNDPKWLTQHGVAPDEADKRIRSGGAIQIDTGKGSPVVIPRARYHQFLSVFGGGNADQGGVQAAPAKKVLSVDDWLNQ